MSVVGCAAAREAAPELALGVLDGAERAEVLLHLSGCPRCQRYVGELSSVADGLASVVPEVEPPAGFARRVEAQIRRGRRRDWRRWATTIALTAAAAAILAVVTVRVVESGQSTPRAATPALHSAAMIGGHGTWVGNVAVSNTSPASLLVSVEYSVPDGTYSLLLHDGAISQRVGAITITRGHGAWAGTAVVHGGATTLGLVGPDGTTVCQAALTRAA
jgi:predicted anti-sigma-YlaC factor YlaD